MLLIAVYFTGTHDRRKGALILLCIFTLGRFYGLGNILDYIRYEFTQLHI